MTEPERRAAARIVAILAAHRAGRAGAAGAAAQPARRRGAHALELRPLGLMTDDERAAATGFRDAAFGVRESASMLDALDGIADRLRRAAGVVALIVHQSNAERDALTAGAADAAAADLDEAAALCRVLEVALAKLGADNGSGA